MEDSALYILRAISLIPEEERIPEVINKLVALFSGSTDGFAMAHIRFSIERIPAAQRTQVISFAVPYLKNIADGSQRAAILMALSLIPEDERKEIRSYQQARSSFQRHHHLLGCDA